uniref:Uncharacterized protein n=1 Tax=Anguilla anguilla TaxID=7936 RepID=A0A0E9SQ84_ANGAN
MCDWSLCHPGKVSFDQQASCIATLGRVIPSWLEVSVPIHPKGV